MVRGTVMGYHSPNFHMQSDGGRIPLGWAERDLAGTGRVRLEALVNHVGKISTWETMRKA